VTNDKGKAVFNLKKGLIYIFQTNYNEIPYISEAVNLTKDTVVREVNIDTYETTVSSDSISMSAGHVVLTQQDGTIYMTEMLAFENPLNLTYTGGFFFVLPAGSGKTFSPAEPSYQNDWSLSGDTVFYIGPIYPGRRILAFQYQLMGNGSVRVVHNLPLKADVFRILAMKGLSIRNPSLKFSKDMKIGKDTYAV
jgi:hypothetical protein